VLVLLALAACQGIDPTPGDEPVGAVHEDWFLRRRLDDARSFRLQGRMEAAASQLRKAIARAPDNADAHALLARTLRDLGRDAEAQPHADRAHALRPPPPPAPQLPLDVPSDGLVFVLSPAASGAALPDEWADPRVPRLLEAHLRRRLPDATVRTSLPESEAESEAWLAAQSPRALIGIRVEEAACLETAKDGPFTLVRLRVVAAVAGALPAPPVELGRAESDPAALEGCLLGPLQRTVEQALASPALAEALAAPEAPADPRWVALAARTVIPAAEARRAREIRAGRAEAGADTDTAREAFARTTALEADAVQNYLDLVKAERARERPTAAAARHDDEAVARLEARIAEERRLRDRLLASLQVDQLAQRAPTPEEVALLQDAPMPDPAALGPRLARRIAEGGPVERRVLRAPGGDTLAVFYFASGGDTALLREEDRNEDGVADRFTAYRDGRAREVWEDRGATGEANAHIVLAPDGISTERIEIDMDADDQPERVFHYEGSALRQGDADTDGDGVLDRFEYYDATGALAAREEDLDGDGRIEVRSEFEAGRLRRREILDPALVDPAP